MAGSFSFGEVFGKGSVFEQLFVWQVLAEVIQAVGAPGLNALTQLVNSKAPVNALSVADAVDAALKGHVSADQAAAEASLSGISRERFDLLLAAAGEPPSPQELVVALRRGLIPEAGGGADATSFEQGIREGRTNNKWTQLYKQLGMQLPSPADALDALLEGQVDDATGRELYQRFGGDPQYFQMLFDTRGSAPTPLEAATMAQRGIIPWDGSGADTVSFLQAFLEGPWRNKWEPSYRRLAEYRPPPRTVTAMVRNGSLSDDQALQLFKDSGMTQEMAAAMLADAHHQKQAATRELAKGDVIALYGARLIDAATATAMLADLHYSADDAAFELQYEDFKQQKALVDKAVARLNTLYVAHKISADLVITEMDALGVPPANRDQLLALWNLEAAANVKILSAAEICDAVKYNLLTVDDALAQLQQQGYSARDAWLRLGVALHAAPSAAPTPGG